MTNYSHEAMSYSRANPSPRYLELQRMYQTMHDEGEKFLNLRPERTFTGYSLFPQAPRIKRLVQLVQAHTILDYGSGKGHQYHTMPISDGIGGYWINIQNYWGVNSIHCYDPCHKPFATLPDSRFDGVICTDVLEHCPEEDIPWIVDEIFGYANKFVFANVASYPAAKTLPNGENAHCTIKPSEWWRRVIEGTASRHSELVWEIWIQSSVLVCGDHRVLRDQRFGTC